MGTIYNFNSLSFMTNVNIYSRSGELKKVNLKNRESSFSTTNKHNSADLSNRFCFRGAKNYKGNLAEMLVNQSVVYPARISYVHESQNKDNKTISPDFVCSTSAPHDFLPSF